jgi:hypothetical protein
MAQSQKLFYKTLIFMPNYLRKSTNFKIEAKQIRILVYVFRQQGLEAVGKEALCLEAAAFRDSSFRGSTVCLEAVCLEATCLEAEEGLEEEGLVVTG